MFLANERAKRLVRVFPSLVGVFLGEEKRAPHASGDTVRADDDVAAMRQRSAMAAVLAWVLPILGGLAVGVLLAVQVFGPPGG